MSVTNDLDALAVVIDDVDLITTATWRSLYHELGYVSTSATIHAIDVDNSPDNTVPSAAFILSDRQRSHLLSTHSVMPHGDAYGLRRSSFIPLHVQTRSAQRLLCQLRSHVISLMSIRRMKFCTSEFMHTTFLPSPLNEMALHSRWHQSMSLTSMRRAAVVPTVSSGAIHTIITSTVSDLPKSLSTLGFRRLHNVMRPSDLSDSGSFSLSTIHQSHIGIMPTSTLYVYIRHPPIEEFFLSTTTQPLNLTLSPNLTSFADSLPTLVLLSHHHGIQDVIHRDYRRRHHRQHHLSLISLIHTSRILRNALYFNTTSFHSGAHLGPSLSLLGRNCMPFRRASS